ncbi:hypothetical protein AAU61_09115 [Desulfocarbo indianensis]|nr:hypothetical protein AAU61_09115 [Desulfocarbo indianensis]
MGGAAARALLLALAWLAVALAPCLAQARDFALVVGVGAFQDQAFEPLRYAAGDARQMAAYLSDPQGGGFAPRDVAVLLDEQATRANILAHTERISSLAKPGDTVLLYFSSHGAYTQERQASVVCHDSRATDRGGAYGPIVSAPSALVRDDLRDFLRRLPARKRAVVLDVCHGADATAGLSRPTARLKGYPPGSETETGPDRAAGPGSGEDQVTLILASCLGRERAWESRQLGSSIFTYYLIQGLRHHKGDLAAAFYYAQERTDRQSTQEKGWCQTPYIIRNPAWRRLILGRAEKG